MHSNVDIHYLSQIKSSTTSNLEQFVQTLPKGVAKTRQVSSRLRHGHSGVFHERG